MKKSNKWFSILEVVIGLSIFIIFITWRFVTDNNIISGYQDSVNISKLKLITNDIYAFLYTYKKIYWTNSFISLITFWDTDNNCNWNDFNNNWDLTDEIDEYCFIYPYLSWSTILFNQWIVNDNNSSLESVYLLNNNNTWFDWLTYRSIFSQNNNLITIWLHEDFINSDKYEGFIGVYDTNTLKYIFKQKVVFE